MFDLKLQIMLIRIGSKPDLFHHLFGGIRLHFLLALLLFVNELAVIYYLTNRWIGLVGNFDEVFLHLFRHSKGIRCRNNALFNITSNQTYMGSSDFAVDPIAYFAGIILPSEKIIWASRDINTLT